MENSSYIYYYFYFWMVFLYIHIMVVCKMICATGGTLGQGKTAAIAYLAFLRKFKHKATIYSNFWLMFGDHEVRSIADLDRIRSGSVFLDELWLWAWSRKSMDNLNETIIKIITDFRKRNVDLYFTQHIFTSTDIFIRDLVDDWFYVDLSMPLGLMEDGIKTKFGRGHIEFEKTRKKYWYNMLMIGQMFDTNEEIKDLQKDLSVYKPIVSQLLRSPEYQMMKKLSSKRQYIRNTYRVSRDEADLIDDLLRARQLAG